MISDGVFIFLSKPNSSKFKPLPYFVLVGLFSFCTLYFCVVPVRCYPFTSVERAKKVHTTFHHRFQRYWYRAYWLVHVKLFLFKCVKGFFALLYVGKVSYFCDTNFLDFTKFIVRYYRKNGLVSKKFWLFSLVVGSSYLLGEKTMFLKFLLLFDSW